METKSLNDFDRSEIVTLTFNKKTAIIPTSEIYRYIKFKKIEEIDVSVESLKAQDILRHWAVQRSIINDKYVFYREFSIGLLTTYLERLKTVKLDKPIIIANNDVVDGLHRIVKAIMEDIPMVKACVLSSSDIAFLVETYKE